jgi:hypothetical protein
MNGFMSLSRIVFCPRSFSCLADPDHKRLRDELRVSGDQPQPDPQAMASNFMLAPAD